MTDLIQRYMYAEDITVLRLNNPKQRNALNSEMLSCLLASLTELRKDADLRVLIFSTTTTDALCAGADIREVLDHAGGVARMQLFSGFYSALEALPVPTIAVCVGNCVGAGAELAAGCDLRVGGENVKFAWAGARLGVPVGPARLVPLIGLAKAKELIFTGRAVEAQEALSLGLLTKIVPEQEAEAHAFELAKLIAKHPTSGVRTIKQMFRDFEDSQSRVEQENEWLQVFQRDGAGLPQQR